MSLSQEVKETHRLAELLRLDMGYETCGCTDCQALYKTLDLGIYGGRVKRFEDVIIIEANSYIKRLPPAASPESPATPHNQQEGAAPPSPIQESPFLIVTVQSPPVKIPYHRRSQATIYDHIINKAITAGGSLRSISDALKRQGIAISHMTISRRIKEMN